MYTALAYVALLASVSPSHDAIDAVKRGDAPALEALVARGADVNTPEPDGTTALHYAAHRDDVHCAAILLRAGAKAAAVNDYGATPLMEAAAAGDAPLLEKLLQAGAGANTASPEGETVLMTAARAGNADAVRLLLRHGAAVNAHEKWKGQTALMWAAAANRADVAKVLMVSGAEVNARSASVTPEKKRPANGNLVSEQPKGNITALLLAAREGALDAARVLADGGADLNAADPDGITPAIVAVINGHYDLAAFLLEAGANAQQADRWGRTVLYAAVDMNTLEPSTTRPSPKEIGQLSALNIARIALAHGANPNVRLTVAIPGRGIPDGPDPLLGAGTTPFIRAAKTGDVAGMRILLEHGADPKLTTAREASALMAAAGQGWRYGDSQIAEAVALESVRYCVALGLDVNAVNDKGETALHGAADRGAEAIARYLLEHGAIPGIKDAKGHTALDAAAGGEERGHPGSPATAAVLRRFMEH